MFSDVYGWKDGGAPAPSSLHYLFNSQQKHRKVSGLLFTEEIRGVYFQISQCVSVYLHYKIYKNRNTYFTEVHIWIAWQYKQ